MIINDVRLKDIQVHFEEDDDCPMFAGTICFRGAEVGTYQQNYWDESSDIEIADDKVRQQIQSAAVSFLEKYPFGVGVEKSELLLDIYKKMPMEALFLQLLEFNSNPLVISTMN